MSGGLLKQSIGSRQEQQGHMLTILSIHQAQIKNSIKWRRLFTLAIKINEDLLTLYDRSYMCILEVQTFVSNGMTSPGISQYYFFRTSTCIRVGYSPNRVTIQEAMFIIQIVYQIK